MGLVLWLQGEIRQRRGRWFQRQFAKVNQMEL
jgi:hypothetical protein